MAQSNNKLVESRVYTRTAYLVNLGLGVEGSGYTFIQLFFSLRNELYPKGQQNEKKFSQR